MSNYKTVFFIIGVLQIILGIFMAIPIFSQFIFSEIDSSFITSSAITLVFGVLFVLSNLDYEKKINLKQAFLLTTLSWLTIAIFGSLPFYFSDLNISFTDSFFESMSGLTTTGSTIISNLELAPKSVLLWRALLQWLGGIGIIVMAITLMPIMNIGGMLLFKVLNTDSSEEILPSSKEISLKLILIYFVLTLLCALAYKIFGMGYFDSLTHSMTTIATGGFSNYNESIGHFNNVKIEITAMLFIILGSLPFIAYIKFLNGNRKVSEVIQPTSFENLDLISSNVDLSGLEVETAGDSRRAFKLKDELTAILNNSKPSYDYIIIDCPPSLSLLTVMALVASDALVVPLQTEFFALEGLTQLMKTIERIKSNLNPNLDIRGILLTMYDKRNKLSGEVEAEARNYFKDKVYSTAVPRNVRLSEAPSHGVPVLIYDKTCPGSRAYFSFTEEFLNQDKPVESAA